MTRLILILSLLLGGSYAQAAGAVSAKTQFATMKDGRKIAYRSIGRGYPVILANRFRGDLDTWDPAFLDELAKRHTVVTFDYSGLGSSTGKQATTYMEYANDMRELAEFLKFKKFVSGGWSMGGFVAQIVMTEFPEVVSHGVFIGTRPPGKNVAPPQKIFFDNALIPDYKLEEEIILFFNPKYESSKLAAQKSHERIAQRKTDRDKPINKEQWEQMLKATGFTNDAYGTLDKMLKTKIPFLVISGENDICFAAEDWLALNGKLPTMQFMLMGATGHGPQHQFPELSARSISNFVELVK